MFKILMSEQLCDWSWESRSILAQCLCAFEQTLKWTSSKVEGNLFLTQLVNGPEHIFHSVLSVHEVLHCQTDDEKFCICARKYFQCKLVLHCQRLQDCVQNVQLLEKYPTTDTPANDPKKTRDIENRVIKAVVSCPEQMNQRPEDISGEKI